MQALRHAEMVHLPCVELGSGEQSLEFHFHIMANVWWLMIQFSSFLIFRRLPHFD